MSKLEDLFAMQLRAVELPTPKREYRFDKKRRFRIDFAWPSLKIAVEVDGGTWTNGCHVRGAGFHNNAVKRNMLAVRGWRTASGDSQMVHSGELLRITEELVRGAELLKEAEHE